MVALAEVRIDDRTWNGAEPSRRAEWQGCISELEEAGKNVFGEEAHHLVITVTEQATLVDLYDQGGDHLAHASIAREALRDLITEYVDIVRQLARQEGPGGLARLEALDMAKKVVHDKAGRVVRRHARPLGIDHDTARKLFTLLLALRVDTTKIVGIHGHRTLK